MATNVPKMDRLRDDVWRYVGGMAEQKIPTVPSSVEGGIQLRIWNPLKSTPSPMPRKPSRSQSPMWTNVEMLLALRVGLEACNS